MNESIKRIFQSNIVLIEKIDKAVYYFRCQQYECGLVYVADSIEAIHVLLEEVLANREYYLMVEVKSVVAMLEGMLEAKKNGDFLLLADIYELQLSSFISRVQELIIEREEFPYSTKVYEHNLSCLEERNKELYERLKEPEEPRLLLDKGYSVEYASCGLMTLAGVDGKGKFYFHTNSHVKQEAFLLANEWAKQRAKVYHVVGLGLGYHIVELLEICEKEEIYIYEGDFDVVRLTCNFVDLRSILENKRVHFIFDEKLKALKEVTREVAKEATMKVAKEAKKKESVVIHYPSYRNLKGDKAFLKPYLPWIRMLEECE